MRRFMPMAAPCRMRAAEGVTAKKPRRQCWAKAAESTLGLTTSRVPVASRG